MTQLFITAPFFPLFIMNFVTQGLSIIKNAVSCKISDTVVALRINSNLILQKCQAPIGYYYLTFGVIVCHSVASGTDSEQLHWST